MRIEDNEWELVKQNRNNVETTSGRYAELVLQQTIVNDLVENTKQEFLNSVRTEQEYLNKLNSKYGEGLLDIETGEIKTT